MKLANPSVLWLLLSIPVMSAWLWHRHQKRQRQWHKQQLTQWLNVNGRFPHGPLLVGLACCLVALARPQWGNATQTTDTTGLQLMILLDLSHSMWVEDADGSRIDQAHQAITTLSAQLTPQDSLGVIGYAGDHQLLLPLTSAHQLLLPSLLTQAEPTFFAAQGSILGPALETAVQSFPQPTTAQPLIFILTDGELHGEPIGQAVQKATAQGVLITVVGIGSEAGGPVPDIAGGVKRDRAGQPYISRLDENALRQIAEMGNGRYLSYLDFPTQISEHMAHIRQTNIGERQQSRPIERYPLFLLLGTLLISWHYRRLTLWHFQPLPLAQSSQHHRLYAIKKLGVRLLPLLLLLSCQTNTPTQQMRQGNEAFAAGAYDEALIAYTSGMATEDTAVFRYNLANTHYRLTEFDQALALTETAVSPSDHRTDLYFTQGNSHFQQGAYHQAIESYQAVLRLSPTDIDAKHNLELAWLMLAKEAEMEREQPQQDGGGIGDEEPIDQPDLPTENGNLQHNPQSESAIEAGLGGETAVTLPIPLIDAIENIQLLPPATDKSSENDDDQIPDW